MIELNENDLLRRARSLEPDILVTIYDHYSPGIFAYSYRLLGDSIMAEDCVSETFLRFLQIMKNKAGPKDHLKAYLYRIAHNWVTDHYRNKVNRTVTLSEELENPVNCHLENQVQKNIDFSNLRKAISTLTPDQQLVISLRFIEGWDNNQVANALQRPVGAVKALQHRALIALQGKMQASEVLDET